MTPNLAMILEAIALDDKAAAEHLMSRVGPEARAAMDQAVTGLQGLVERRLQEVKAANEAAAKAKTGKRAKKVQTTKRTKVVAALPFQPFDEIIAVPHAPSIQAPLMELPEIDDGASHRARPVASLSLRPSRPRSARRAGPDGPQPLPF